MDPITTADIKLQNYLENDEMYHNIHALREELQRSCDSGCGDFCV